MSIQEENRLSALAYAARSLAPAHGGDLLFEQFLQLLCLHEPGVARVVGAALEATVSSRDRDLGREVRARVGEYRGVVDVTEHRVRVDVLLLTVKPTELEAVLAAFQVDALKDKFSHSGDDLWVFQRGDVTYGLAMVGVAGDVETALRIGELRAVVSFDAAILIGMAAGVQGEINIGDVVVSESVIGYEYQTLTKDGPQYSPRTSKPLVALYRRVRTMEVTTPGWAQGIAEEIRQHPKVRQLMTAGKLSPVMKVDWKPAVDVGGILAGAKLWEDGSLDALRARLDVRVLAAEMEGMGFVTACSERDVRWLVVRGIADYGKTPRKKGWQFPATYAAAALVRDAIPNGRIPILRSQATFNRVD